jgi:cell division ATPase FtsA
VELSAGTARVIVAVRENSRLRVTGRGEAGLAEGAVNGGLVVDRESVATALATAFAAAERGQRVDRSLVAIDGDDVRTYHLSTSFEREASEAPVAAGEISRATREAAMVTAKTAASSAEDDPALRGVPTARIHEDVASLSLDGRHLATLVGQRGGLVEVWSDVSLAPLVLSGAALGALESARHRGAVIPGAYALGRLLVESGVLDAGVLRLGSDVTSLAILREGRVVATRAFGLGRIAIASRPDRLEGDARVWADCVLASLHKLDGLPPARWLFVGIPDSLLALPRALGTAVGEMRGGAVDVSPLSVGIASRAYADVQLRAEDLVAVGAAAIASGIFAT